MRRWVGLGEATTQGPFLQSPSSSTREGQGQDRTQALACPLMTSIPIFPQIFSCVEQESFPYRHTAFSFLPWLPCFALESKSKQQVRTALCFMRYTDTYVFTDGDV